MNICDAKNLKLFWNSEIKDDPNYRGIESRKGQALKALITLETIIILEIFLNLFLYLFDFF